MQRVIESGRPLRGAGRLAAPHVVQRAGNQRAGNQRRDVERIEDDLRVAQLFPGPPSGGGFFRTIADRRDRLGIPDVL